MKRWMLVLMLWSAQAVAKPAMKAEPVESKAMTPSFMCQTGPFEVSFTAIEAKHGQQIHVNFETAATGASLKYQVNTGEGFPREGNYTLSSTSNTIDPCAPLSQAPAPQTNSLTVAPRPQSVGPVTVIPGPVTVTVVTPPQEAPLRSDQVIIALPGAIKAGTQITLTLWAQKPILAKSMQFTLEQIVPADPVAYAEWELKQEAKAEARAARISKREAKRYARQEARAVKVAIKSQEREKKAAIVSVQAAASFESKTQKAADKQVKISARMERRQVRRDRRELKLTARVERRAPRREAKVVQRREHNNKISARAEKRYYAKLSKRERRELRLSIRREKRAPIRVARVERRHRHHEARFALRIERRDRRVVHAKERRIANEPKLLLRTKKHWARYQAKDKKLVAKLAKLDANDQSRRDWLETRRYNLLMVNVSKVESAYEVISTASIKAELKLELYDEVLAMKSEREATYNLYVEARNQEQAQQKAAAALEASNRASAVAVAEAPALPPMPAPIPETYGPPPAPDASWQAGCWRWSGSQYIWISGHWILPVLPSIKVVVQKEQKPAPKPAKGYTATKPK